MSEVIVPFCNSRPWVPRAGEFIHYALVPKNAEYKMAFMIGTSAPSATFHEMPGIPWPLLDRPFTMLHYRQSETVATAYAAVQRLQCFAYLLRIVPTTAVSYEDAEESTASPLIQALANALPVFPTQVLACILQYLDERRDAGSPPREQRVLIWSTFDAPTTSVIYDLAVCNIVQAICSHKSCAHRGCGQRTAGYVTTCVPYDSQARQLAPMFPERGISLYGVAAQPPKSRKAALRNKPNTRTQVVIAVGPHCREPRHRTEAERMSRKLFAAADFDPGLIQQHAQRPKLHDFAASTWNVLNVSERPKAKRHQCQTCGRTMVTLAIAMQHGRVCGRCRLVYYCDKECQRRDWPVHKTNCRSVEKGAMISNDTCPQ